MSYLSKKNNPFFKFIALPFPKKIDVIEIVLTAIYTELRLRGPFFDRWFYRLSSFKASSNQKKLSKTEILSTLSALRFRLEKISSYWFFPMTCLRETLILKILCDRRSVPVCVKLGVRREGSLKMQAHAWIELADGTKMSTSEKPALFHPFHVNKISGIFLQ